MLEKFERDKRILREKKEFLELKENFGREILNKRTAEKRENGQNQNLKPFFVRLSSKLERTVLP